MIPEVRKSHPGDPKKVIPGVQIVIPEVSRRSQGDLRSPEAQLYFSGPTDIRPIPEAPGVIPEVPEVEKSDPGGQKK